MSIEQAFRNHIAAVMSCTCKRELQLEIVFIIANLTKYNYPENMIERGVIIESIEFLYFPYCLQAKIKLAKLLTLQLSLIKSKSA